MLDVGCSVPSGVNADLLWYGMVNVIYIVQLSAEAAKLFVFLVYMYYMHCSYRTVPFGKNSVYYIQICMVNHL